MKRIRVEAAPHQAVDPFQELGISIIRQAAEDYRELGERLQQNGSAIEKKHMENEMKKISRFFLSGWYSTLSGCDNGADVLELLDQEVFGDD